MPRLAGVTLRVAVGFLLAGGCLAVLRAEEPAPSLEQRVKELEEMVRRLQKGQAKDPAGDKKDAADNKDGDKAKEKDPAKDKDGEKKAVTAGWDNSFILRSADKKFSLRITGQVQADYRAYLESGDRTDIDTFVVRRARFGLEATLFEFYELRFLPEFGQGSTRLLDAYCNVHYWDPFQVELGKFKQPFSYEFLIQDRFVPTLERSLIDQLGPARDAGLMVHGQKLFDDQLDYAVAVFNGERDGDTDTNDHKDVAGRVAWLPFNRPEAPPELRGLQLGIAGTTGVEQEPVNPPVLRTPAGVPWFAFLPAVRADGLRNRWSPEFVYFRGGLGFVAQYFRQDQQLRPSFNGPTSAGTVDVGFEGFFVLVTYLVTGEERTTYSTALEPLRPFDLRCPLAMPGAWELVARVSRLNVDDVVFAPGPARLADPARVSSGASELTLGFNWYLNRWVRTQFNWEHAWFDDPVQLGPGAAGRLTHEDTVMTRFQIIF